MTDTLRIRWTGGDRTFEPGVTVRVGRDPGSDVQPQNNNVSRQHVEITHSGTQWVLRDVGSAQGTWRDGRQVQTVEVRGTLQVTLGREGRGEVVTLEASPTGGAGVTDSGARHEGTGPTQVVGGPGTSPGAPTSDRTVVVGDGGAHRPGGPLRSGAVIGDTVVTGDVLNLECAGRSYSFRPGQEVVIGRDTDCDVVSSNPTVSRRHARLRHDGAGWVLTDQGSSGGTFVEGESVSEFRLSGSTAVWLGDDTTGERVVLVASGESPQRSRRRGARPRSRSLVISASAAVVALVVLALLAPRLFGGGSGPSNDELGRATVRLLAGNFAGSGTIIDAEQGLILTNAHVVAPDASGSALRDVVFDFMLEPSEREVEVLVAPELGKAAEPRYRAEVIAADGYLDLAVLRITRTIGGRIVEPDSGDLDGLVSVSVGNSTDLATGDEIRVFGYPRAAQSSSVTLTQGVVSGQVQDDRLGSNRGMLNISASISPGNSGGLAVDADGRLVGVPSLVRDGTVASMRPSEFAREIIEAARDGEDYESPWFRPLGSEEIDAVRFVEPARTPGMAFSCRSAPLGSVRSGAVGVAFDFEGFAPGEHQDLLIAVVVGDDIVGVWALDDEFPVRWPSESGCATVTVPIDATGSDVGPGSLSLIIGLGPDYRAVDF